MGFIPRRLIKQNLNTIDVLVQDNQNEYFNVVEMPSTLTQGRASFKLFGSEFLKGDVPLKMEILDAAGNTVFVTPVDLVGEEVAPFLPYIFVTIEVYRPPINAPGLAEITILGEIDPNTVNFDIPTQFQNTYNVKYNQKINLDVATSINSQPIFFYKNPTILAKEILKTTIVETSVTQSTFEVTSSSGIPRSDLENEVFQASTGSQEQDDGIKEFVKPNKDLEDFANSYKYMTGMYGTTPAIIARRGSSTRFASKEQPPYKISIPAGGLSAKMQGGFVTIPPHTTIVRTTAADGRAINTSVAVPKFTTRIREIINDTTLVPSEPPTITHPNFPPATHAGSAQGEVAKFLDKFENIPATMSFEDVSTNLISSSIHFQSFIDVTLKNLRPFSGDVYRLKVHGKMQSTNSHFTAMADTVLESPELLRDVSSPSGFLRTGYFIDQNHIDTYWVASSVDDTTKGSKVSLTHTSSLFVDSLFISGSTRGVNEFIEVQNKPDYQFILKKNLAYTVSAKIQGKTTPKTRIDGSVTNTGKLYFHISGSKINDSKKKAESGYLGVELTSPDDGQVVVLELNKDLTEFQNFEIVEHTFIPKLNLDKLINNDTVLQIRVESGEWHISNLSLRPAQDTGFSPDEFNIILPVPRTQRPDKLDMFIEYFDVNSNAVETITKLENIGISGSGLIIDGTDNLLTGSLFMGNVQGEGIEAAGVESAFIRTVGYEGFKSASLAGNGGFMMWSGSVLKKSPDNYAGAGLEIHDGTTGSDQSYFKFRTEDADFDGESSFDVKSSRFFFGSKTAGNFISGANSIIEISSSNFHLTPEGNITASEFRLEGGIITDDVTIQGDLTANTINTPAAAVTPSASISAQGLARFVSASIGGFEVSTDRINSTNNKLVLKSSGEITASSGNIGGFEVSSDTINAISDKLVLKSSGEITGSDVLFTGGTIGGFEIIGDRITGSNLIIDSSGDLRTKNFDTLTAGWRISALGNGTAEFENVRVRGTLRTTVFEKETVNAVGGQLYVANSTALSGSASATDTALFCENVSGFEQEEIVFAKKVDGTGFTKEFMKVTGSTRTDESSDDNMSGFLHVERSFGGPATESAFTKVTELAEALTVIETDVTVDDADPNSNNLLHQTIRVGDEYMKVTGSNTTSNIIQVIRGTNGSAKATHSTNDDVDLLDPDAAFLMGLVSPATAYTEGQVIVSTGRYISGTGENTVGSGYILINANPTTGTTPYIDFCERTGSGIYDVRKKTTIGDLSSLINTRLGDSVNLPKTNPGYGLASENVYLSGEIRANSGSIGGIKMHNDTLFTGDVGTYGSTNTGFYLDDSSNFSLGDKFSWDGTTLRITGSLAIVAGDMSSSIASNTATITLNSSSFSTRVTNQSSASTAITQTADAIRLEASDSSGSAAANKATFNIQSGSISTRVTNFNSASSAITQTADAISLVATAGSGSAAANRSSIIIQSGSIALRVSGAESASSAITQTSDEIALRVTSNAATGSNVAGLAINQQGVQITGEKLEFVGSSFSFGNKGSTGAQYISGSNGNLEMSSSGYFLKSDGSAIFAGGAIELQADGDITSTEYLIEKSRLFGHGGDGTAVLKHQSCTLADGGNGIGTRVDNLSIKDANGVVVCSRVSSQNGWTMQGDWYVYDLTLDDATGSGRFVTNGFRLFVFGTLTIDANYIISHNGSGASQATPGEGAGEGTLKAGSDGGAGGEGGASPGQGGTGGDGGGSGGNGGIVFISARNIVNNGTIQAQGGQGDAGEAGGTE